MSNVFFNEVHARYHADIEAINQEEGSASDGLADSVRYDCRAIAGKMAWLLAWEGRNPYITTLLGTMNDTGTNRQALVPLPYGGHVEWHAHVVCMTDDTLVHDPLLPQPMEVQSYLRAAFAQQVEVSNAHLHQTFQP